MGIGGAYQDAIEREQKRKAQVKADAKIKAEALAAEATAVYNLGEIRKLEAQVTVLTRLVERMGWVLKRHELALGWASQWDYTLSGQAEYDAAMHDAEGSPPDAGMLEGIQ